MYDLQVIHSLSEVNYNGDRNPLAGQRLMMQQQSIAQPASQTPDGSTPDPNQKPMTDSPAD
jgi:hypothetical protein